MFAKFKFIFLTLIITSLLTACSVFNKKDDEEKSGKGNSSIFKESPQATYNRASKFMSVGRYEDALDQYNSFIVQFPFGTLSETARLERIFTLNKLNLTEEASESVEQFIRQYPLHPNIDYAYFMRGIITFEKKATGVFGKLRGASEVSRNKENMEKSFKAFEELVNKFPNSRYAPDARQRMIYLRNKKAEHELRVAKFYANRNANVGAINRCQYILENYPEAPAVIDALKLMVKTYKKMGLDTQASQAQSILDTNYANITGISNSRKQSKPSLWSKLPNLNPFTKKVKEQKTVQQPSTQQSSAQQPQKTVLQTEPASEKKQEKKTSFWRKLMNISLAK